MILAPLALALLVVPSAGDPAADYRRLIDEYRVAGSARVPNALAGWSAGALMEAVTRVAPAGSPEATARWLEAAALAQLEAGWVALNAGRPGAAARQIDAGRILVGRLRSVVENDRKKSVKLVPGGRRALEAGDGFAARWLAAAGELLHGTGHWLAAQRHYELAAEVYPDHPRLRLGLGTVYEIGAGNPALTAVADNGPPGAARQSAETYRRRLLRWSVDQYEKALKLDPSLHEARVRLGRAEMLLGRRARAAAALEAVRSSKPTPALTYLACMLLARMQHHARTAARAERLYLEALAAWPEGQRAAVGLSHARWLQGRSVEADFLRRGLELQRPDPWASYSLGQFRRLDGSMAQLRAAVWP